MSDSTKPVDPIAAVQGFANWTERVAGLLQCSYSEAAVFLVRLGSFVPLITDRVFQDQLSRYIKAVEHHPMDPTIATSSHKVVH